MALCAAEPRAEAALVDGDERDPNGGERRLGEGGGGAQKWNCFGGCKQAVIQTQKNDL